MRRAIIASSIILSAALTGCNADVLSVEALNDPCSDECSNRDITESGCDKGKPMAILQLKSGGGKDVDGTPVPAGKMSLWVSDPAICTSIYWVTFKPAKGNTDAWAISIQSDGFPIEKQEFIGADAGERQRTNGVYKSADGTIVWCMYGGKAELCLNDEGEQADV